MTGSLNAKVVLTMDASGTVAGAEVATASLGKVKVAALEAGAAGGAMVAPFDAATVAQKALTDATAASNTTMSAGVAVRQQEIARLQQLAANSGSAISSVQALAAAQQSYNATVNQARTLLGDGAITQDQYKLAVAAAATQFALSREEALGYGAAIALTGEAAEKTVVSGKKLEDLLAHLGVAGGIARNEISGLKIVLNLVEDNPVVATLAAIIAVTAAVIAIDQTYKADINHLIDAEQARGNALGLTRQQYIALAAQISATADVSERDGLKITAALLNGGPASTAVANALTDALRGYANLTGQDLPAAAAALAHGLADPVAMLKQLSDNTGAVDDKTRRLVQALMEQGDLQQAQLVAAQQYADTYKPLADNVTTAGTAFDSLKKHVVDFFDAAASHTASYVASLPRNVVNGVSGFFNTLMYGTLDPTGGPPPGPNPADVAAQQAKAAADKAKAARNAASLYTNGIIDQYDPFGGQLRTLANQRTGVEAQYQIAIGAGADPTQALTDKTKALAEIETQETKVKKEQRDAALALNPALAAQLARIKELIDNAPTVLAQAKAQADEAVNLADNIDAGTLAKQKFSDQLEIDKATLPYSTALLNAHGQSAKALRDIINALTNSMKENAAAQHYTAAVGDVQSQFAGLDTSQLSASASAALSAAQFDLAKKKLDDWMTATLADLSYSEDGYNKYAGTVQTIYSIQLAALYKTDEANQKDWRSGIAEGLNQLQITQENWAAKSQSLVAGMAANWEDDFVQGVLNSKDPLSGFFSWFGEQMLKMAYEMQVAPAANSLISSVVGSIGSALGLGSAGSAFNYVAVTPQVSIPTFHTGGEIGSTLGFTRSINPAAWAHAARYHGGGAVNDYGLGPNEVPIIAEKGEKIYTEKHDAARDAAIARPMMVSMAGGGGAAPVINLNMINNSGTPLTGKQGKAKKQSDGSWSFEFIVEQVSSQMAQNSQNGTDPLTASLERTHSVRRQPS